jgi:Cu/Ag efflux pump CusA
MRLLVASSLRSRGLVAVLGAGALIFGAVQLTDMPRDALPEFSPPIVEVQTEALGLSAHEIEQLVTTPLEQDLLNGVAFLESIRSESVPGLSRIEMVFEPGTDVRRARQVVNERLTQAHAIPNVSTPPQMIQPLSSMSRVLMVRVSSDDRSLMELGLLGRWTIRPKLMGVPGVANVSMWGHQEQQLQVQVDPTRLQAEGVTLDQVIQTTGNALWVSHLTFLEASTPGAGGFFDTASQRIGVEHTQPIRSPEDLAKVPLDDQPTAADGATGPVKRIGDVTTVVEDHQPLIGNAVFTDGPGLLIVVEKLPEANVVEVTEALEDALEALRPGFSGVTLDSTFFRPARYVENANDNLRSALLIGLVLLVLALGAFLFEARIALVSLVSILLSMSAAVAVLAIRGETLNLMVLAGLVLALAVVIDDAVTSAFAIARGIDRRDDNGLSVATRLARSVLAARRPLLYGTVILFLAILPVFVLHGETGAFLPPLALSYLGAVVASTVVALTVTPALGMLLLGPSARSHRLSPALGSVQRRYDGLVSRLVGSIRPGVAVGAVLLLVGVAALPLLERGDSMVPAFKDRDLLVHWSGAPGTSLTEMSRITARAGEELRDLPGVDNVGGHVGRAILGDQTVGVNSSEIWVRLAEGAEYDETVAAVEDVVNGYPGIEKSVLTYGRDRIDDILGEPDGVEGKDLTVRTFGYRLDEITTQATRVRELVASIDGVADTTIELPVMEPTLEVSVDLDRAQAFGIKPGDVRRAAATVLSGIVVGNLFEDQKVFEVVVRGTPDTGRSITDVGRMLVTAPGGGTPVQLDQVADVRIVPSPNVIRHVGASRSIDVGIDVSGRDLGSVASDIEDAIGGLVFPIEYHAEVLDDYADRQSDRQTFLAVVAAALIGIFLLLQSAFGTWRLAAVGLVALPGALAGGVVAAVVDGDRVSIGTLVGFLVLFGIAARHSVLLVHGCHELEDAEGGTSDAAYITRAAGERLAPTITSAATTALALLPLLFFGGQAGHEVVHPMAAVILGGLVTSTALTLVVVPALYARFGSRSPESRERFDLYPEHAVADELEVTVASGGPRTAES